jgi:phosphatidate cytidylyltransferase
MLGVSLNVWITLGVIYAILIFATVFIRIQKKLNPAKDRTELFQRVNSWWIIIGLFSLAIVTHKAISIFFFAFVSFLALREFLHLVPKRENDRRVIFWCFLSIPMQCYWVYTGWYNMFIIFVPVYMFLLIPLRMIIVGDTNNFLRTAGIYHWGLMSTVYCLGHLSFFHAFEEKNHIAGSAGMILFMACLTQFNDVAQYVWGKSFGKHKIIPKVSPNKTWEGFLGGMATTMVFTWFLAPLLTPIDGWQRLLAGFIFSVGGFVGDVVESAVKRDIGVKDSGNMLPGHGGILDRVDSLTYTAPLFFHFVKYFYY